MHSTLPTLQRDVSSRQIWDSCLYLHRVSRPLQLSTPVHTSLSYLVLSRASVLVCLLCHVLREKSATHVVPKLNYTCGLYSNKCLDPTEAFQARNRDTTVTLPEYWTTRGKFAERSSRHYPWPHYLSASVARRAPIWPRVCSCFLHHSDTM